MHKLKLFLATVIFSNVLVAQEITTTNTTLFAPKISYLDSLKATFVNHTTSACIDERWMKEVSDATLSNEMFFDIENMNIDQKVMYDLDTELLKKRLHKLDVQSPFDITYNPALENVIKSFLKNRSKSFEKQMALAEYYFPIFEEYLSKYDLPLEIKYLAIVESALQPKAKSKVGAGGLWQFMPATGKQYKLNVTTYVDDRHDPLKATDAACHYMINMYEIFGDWSLVLASYNCGPGNVSKAIRRSGGKTDYWEIRKHLPEETANYVPAFLATMYIYEFKKEHGLVAQKAKISFFDTDTVMVKKAMTFKQLSDLLDVSEEQLEFFNPTYKSKYIPSIDDEVFYLRLPKNKIGLFISNEDKIYTYLDHLEQEKAKNFQLAQVRYKDSVAKQDSIALTKKQKPVIADDTEYVEVVKKRTKEVVNKSYHKIKSGETLSEIADKNNVLITDLRKWNNIKGSNINAGQSLVIQTTKKVTVNEVVKKPKPKTELVKTVEPKDALVSEDIITEKAKNSFQKGKIEVDDDFYTVQKGDSIFSISKKFPNLTVDDLKKKNDLKNDNIQPGMKLKIAG